MDVHGRKTDKEKSGKITLRGKSRKDKLQSNVIFAI